MKIEVSTVKGFQDIMPPYSLKRDAVKKIVEKWFKLYGFVPIETPVIEFDELMRSDVLPSEEADEAVSERFKLEDRGGRKLGLRYEFTFQLSRIFKENPNLKIPLKRYQIGEVFRDEPTSSDRFRQFTQCDIDIVGDPSIKADIECLSAFSEILKELKINAEIVVNNRALLNSIVESVEIKHVKNVIKELDKLDKLGPDQVKINLKKYASTNQVITLFKLLDKSLEFFEKNAFQGVESLTELFSLCKKYDVKIKFNPFLARGLSYYTGNIFEIKEEGKSALAGGGRYDKTIGKYLAKEIPSVGISFGLERLTESANIETPPAAQTIIISINQDNESIKLATKLRKQNISCSIEFGRPGKGLEYANSQSIPYAIFIGEEEMKIKKIKLRDLKSGKESMLSESQLIKELKK
ncbi:MAG: histidine--tRNA ligase [Nanoarchaeota archaeon]